MSTVYDGVTVTLEDIRRVGSENLDFKKLLRKNNEQNLVLD